MVSRIETKVGIREECVRHVLWHSLALDLEKTIRWGLGPEGAEGSLCAGVARYAPPSVRRPTLPAGRRAPRQKGESRVWGFAPGRCEKCLGTASRGQEFH